MGCDIHAVFQAKRDGQWHDVPSKFEGDRHYFLFAWLAGVRNGHGFAGVPTHTPVRPISEPRGLPDDFMMDGDEHPTTEEAYPEWRKEYRGAEELVRPARWMGDHSRSWLTADEILGAARPAAWRVGIVEREWFDAWDGATPPESFSYGIVGCSVQVDDPERVGPTTTHVRIRWRMPASELDYFIDEVRRLKEQHGDVRMVFGFDN